MPSLGSERVTLLSVSRWGADENMLTREYTATDRRAVEITSALFDIAIQHGLARGPRDVGIFLESSETLLDLGRPFSKDDVSQLIAVHESEQRSTNLEGLYRLLGQFLDIFSKENRTSVITQPTLEAYQLLATYLGKEPVQVERE